MMEAARVRIGRVKMKNGGADVRVLDREPAGEIIGRAHDLISDAMEDRVRPSAFVGMFFWRDDEEPWRPIYRLAWQTIDPNLSLPLLMRTAGAIIQGQASIIKAEDRVMHNLGYRRDDDPDPAS